MSPDYNQGSERPLPKMQRRGAVIILGMLALARRGVVADRVEVLVKIGLGNLGKVDALGSDVKQTHKLLYRLI